MARTQEQVNAYLAAFRNWADQDRRIIDNLTQLRNLYDDLGLSGLTQAEVDAQNPGLAVADVTAALTTANTLLTQYTAAVRAALNKIGHGAP